MVSEESKVNVKDVLEGIHAVINEPLKRSPERNSPADNSLRELLLAIHHDSELAKFVKDIPSEMDSIYDPKPDDNTTGYLDWWVHQERIYFVYKQPSPGPGRNGYHYGFTLREGRFYSELNEDRELLDFFPELTVQKLEEGIKNAIIEYKKYKARKR